MSETKVMSFEEFRAAVDAPFGEVIRQQRAFLRNDAAAGAILQPGAVPLRGWIEWPDASVSLRGWPVWESNAPPSSAG